MVFGRLHIYNLIIGTSAEIVQEMKGLVVFALVLFCLGLVPETEATLLDRQVERQRYLGRNPYCVPKGGYCLTRNDCCLKPSKIFKYKCAHWQVNYKKRNCY